ncbi:MAG: M15 family metallopeptidase [Halieaceae bacterium]|nr:M15 family metallopeptidase [Halieaceae bacterium]
MLNNLTLDQLVGRDDAHVVDWNGTGLNSQVLNSFKRLSSDAKKAGFDLRIASGFRSFDRQLTIFNGKARGDRRIFDDNGDVIKIDDLSSYDLLCSILRFSALPGASRHHWGTDIDVYDASAVSSDYVVKLSLKEVSSGGMFDSLHNWLDLLMEEDKSHGFYRPYAVDVGGVAPERWHLSFAPLALIYEDTMSPELLKSALDDAAKEKKLELHNAIGENIEEIYNRFITSPPEWAPFL